MPLFCLFSNRCNWNHNFSVIRMITFPPVEPKSLILTLSDSRL